jgi:hypothetical protein
MLRYARADLRQSALIACAVVAGFSLLTGYVIPTAGAMLKAIGL